MISEVECPFIYLFVVYLKKKKVYLYLLPIFDQVICCLDFEL